MLICLLGIGYGGAQFSPDNAGHLAGSTGHLPDNDGRYARWQMDIMYAHE